MTLFILINLFIYKFYIFYIFYYISSFVFTVLDLITSTF